MSNSERLWLVTVIAQDQYWSMDFAVTGAENAREASRTAQDECDALARIYRGVKLRAENAREIVTSKEMT